MVRQVLDAGRVTRSQSPTDVKVRIDGRLWRPEVVSLARGRRRVLRRSLRAGWEGGFTDRVGPQGLLRSHNP